MALSTTPYSAHAQGGVWKVTYTEPSGSLQFDFEMGSPRDLLWVPDESSWESRMPEWAQGRRDEILQRIVTTVFGSGKVEILELQG